MLENIRKYTGLMVVVLVLLAAGLIFTMQSFNRGGGDSGEAVLTVNGEGVNNKEFHRLGSHSDRVLGTFYSQGQQAILQRTYGNNQSPELTPLITRFNLIKSLISSSSAALRANLLTNYPQNYHFPIVRMVLRQEAAKHGLYVTREECEKVLKTQLFVTPDQEFDQSAFNRFKENVLDHIPMKESEFLKLIEDAICAQKLAEIKGGTFDIPADQAYLESKFDAQQISFFAVQKSIDDYIAAEDPAEADVKKYWEENRDFDAEYKTDRKVRLSLIKILRAPLPEKPKAPEGEAAKSPIMQDAYKSKLAHWEKQVEVVNKQFDDLKNKHFDFMTAHEEAQVESPELDEFAFLKQFNETEAGKAGPQLTVTETKLVTIEELGKLLNNPKLTGATEQANPGLNFATLVFKEATKTGVVKSPAVVVDGAPRGNIIFRVDEILEPKLKPFEEAKAHATQQLKQKQAREAMVKEMEELHAKITKMLDEGKGFTTEIAEELKLEYKLFSDVKKSSPTPEGLKIAGQQAFGACQTVKPGKLAKPILRAGNGSILDSTALLLVSERTVTKNPNDELAKTQTISHVAEMTRSELFIAWLTERVKAAEISPKSVVK